MRFWLTARSAMAARSLSAICWPRAPVQPAYRSALIASRRPSSISAAALSRPFATTSIPPT
ncbi:hypothetical protein BJP26_13025 [Sphingomonas melonis TY]|nr:hypothetical protein BJP26_13025 [Sphingomonas melonis TY]